MTYLALAELGVLLVTISAFAGLLRAQQRAHARREDLLLNQLLHAVGKPWQPAPETEASWERAEQTLRDRETREVRFTPSPEQFPQN